jgi:hypothetical protein
MDPEKTDASPGPDAGETTSEASTDTDSRRSRQQRTPIADLVDPFLRDKGKGEAGESGTYRSDAARELDRFVGWLREDDLGREPTVADLDPIADEVSERLDAAIGGLPRATPASAAVLIGQSARECSRFSEQLRENERLEDIEDLLAGLPGLKG